MKGKNILFGLYALIIIASEISAMQLVTRRIPKSMHHVKMISPMKQKRKYYETAGEIVAAAMFILPLGYLVGQAATVMGCYIVGNVYEVAHKTYQYVRDPKAFRAENLYYDMAEIGSDECSWAYIKKIPCSNPRCCKYLDQHDIQKKRTEFFYDINQERLFLINVKEGLQNLHNKEEKAKLLLTHNKIDMGGYEKIMGLLEHKKNCYIKQATLFDGSDDSCYQDVKNFITQSHSKE